ncbi:MAG: polymer-forming cytoskeletal protein [Alphaproteobacteria bacterium]|nr:polymer-forming cytoskeletal protein [Alphaproteobacteria bacterium]
MFSKSQKNQKGGKAGGSAVPSIISADLTLTGNIVTDGDVHVDGRVEGDITCSDLSVGESGSVAGEVVADSVRILGEVRGRVRALSVYIAASARMHGDVLHKELAVETGAVIDGLCRNLENPKEAGLAQLAPPRPAQPVAANSLPPGQATAKSGDPKSGAPAGPGPVSAREAKPAG